MQFWVNGKFEEEGSPSGEIPAASAGRLLGLGVFTTIGIWRSLPFAIERHLTRLRHDAAVLDLPCSFEDAAIADALCQLVQRCGVTRGTARITLTQRGDGRWSTESGSDLTIHVGAVATSGLEPEAATKLGWSSYRVDPRRATAGIKCTSYADFWLAWKQAQAQGFDDAILCNSAGALCETARANLFWVRDQTVFTPSLTCGPLPGIARAMVLDWLREDGHDVREAVFSLPELAAADAIFLTNSATGVREARLEGAEAQNNAAPHAIIGHLVRRWNTAVAALA